MYVCYSLHCASTGQLTGVRSFHSPCESKRLNLCCQSWWKAPLCLTGLILSGLFSVVWLENIGFPHIPYTQIPSINQPANINQY